LQPITLVPSRASDNPSHSPTLLILSPITTRPIRQRTFRPTKLPQGKPSASPSLSPTLFTNFNDNWQSIYCTESRSYSNSEATDNTRFIITGIDHIQITLNSFVINQIDIFPRNNLIVLINYQSSKDILHFYGFPASYQAISDISYATNPMTFYLSNDQVLMFSNINEIDSIQTGSASTTSSNIQFSSEKEEKKDSGSFSLSSAAFQLTLLCGGLVVVGLILVAMTILQDKNDQNEKKDSLHNDNDHDEYEDDDDVGEDDDEDEDDALDKLESNQSNQASSLSYDLQVIHTVGGDEEDDLNSSEFRSLVEGSASGSGFRISSDSDDLDDLDDSDSQKDNEDLSSDDLDDLFK
jgi:hypothetical protein